jgi:hypothetical protein
MIGQFPTDPMMGPSSQLGVINAKTTVQGPGGFEQLLNALREAGRTGADKLATPTGSKIAGLAAPAMYATGSLMSGDIARGVGELGGGIVGSNLVSGLASGLEKGGTKGKLAGAAVRLAGGLLGGGVGGGVTSAVAGGLGRAAEGITGAAARGQMARGESPGVIPGVGGKGIEGLTINDIERIAMLNPKVAEQLMPTYNRMRDSEMNRQMQLNQQLGQLTGGLNQQKYMAQLAGGAQSEAGATTRSILTAANPYAESVFQYRG